jgi:hypothetical protein
VWFLDHAGGVGGVSSVPTGSARRRAAGDRARYAVPGSDMSRWGSGPRRLVSPEGLAGVLVGYAVGLSCNGWLVLAGDVGMALR